MELKIVTDLLAQFKEIERLNIERAKEQSEIDLQLSAFYHKVEGIKLGHVAISHKLMKELQDILRRRRINKYEVILLRTVYDNLRDKMQSVSEKLVIHNKKHNSIMEEIKEAGLKI